MGFCRGRQVRRNERAGQSRELARHDFTPRARRPADPDISGHVDTLVNRVAERSVQEIDELIFKLRQRREQLISETERVQREVIEYAALTQSTMESTKIISESLAQFNKAPDAVRTSGPQVQDVPAPEQRSETQGEQRNETRAGQRSETRAEQRSVETAAEQRAGETEIVAEQSDGAGEPAARQGEDETASGVKAKGAAESGDRRSETI
jgi:hypothetical protein